MGAVMNRLAFVGERKVMKPLYCMVLVKIINYNANCALHNLNGT